MYPQIHFSADHAIIGVFCKKSQSHHAAEARELLGVTETGLDGRSAHGVSADKRSTRRQIFCLRVSGNTLCRTEHAEREFREVGMGGGRRQCTDKML